MNQEDDENRPEWSRSISSEDRDEDSENKPEWRQNLSFGDSKTEMRSSTPSVGTKLTHVSGSVHNTIVEAVKELDEGGRHATGLRVVAKVTNGPYIYAVYSVDNDSRVIDQLKQGNQIERVNSEKELKNIDKKRRFSVGISREVKSVQAKNRHMAIVKGGSEYQRDEMDVAGIRLVGKEEREDGTYYDVSFESHKDVESEFDTSD